MKHEFELYLMFYIILRYVTLKCKKNISLTSTKCNTKSDPDFIPFLDFGFSNYQTLKGRMPNFHIQICLNSCDTKHTCLNVSYQLVKFHGDVYSKCFILLTSSVSYISAFKYVFNIVC